jgi:hypothetical protein
MKHGVRNTSLLLAMSVIIAACTPPNGQLRYPQSVYTQ